MLLQKELGQDGLLQIGGSKWWQWRNFESGVRAEWIEAQSKSTTDQQGSFNTPKRIMLYIHGGAFYFGSNNDHRYQMQRHARKMHARVFSPEYRLAPQFPFPCGLQDCLAAYLYLLERHHPKSIILAGDSAGGGLVVSLLCILRNQSIPLPAGGILISPWVDLTHSFPSIAGDTSKDYVPQPGFHHKPSRSWPPLTTREIRNLRHEVKSRRTPTSANDSHVSSNFNRETLSSRRSEGLKEQSYM